MPTTFIRKLTDSGHFAAIDLHFARLMQRLSGTVCEKLVLASALVRKIAGSGNVCLDLEQIAETPIGDAFGEVQILCPNVVAWIASLKVSPVVGAPGDYRPLILDNSNRLYLYRYWLNEKILTQALRNRTRTQITAIDTQRIRESLEALFPQIHSKGIDWQKTAAAVVTMKHFSVISGGAGTGKTTTVAKIIAHLQNQSVDNRLRVELAAPTGKAAARLNESIGAFKSQTLDKRQIEMSIFGKAKTLHRLLKFNPNSGEFGYGAHNQLAADIVVVDEASMVDLTLMTQLVQALDDNTRLLLIGDKDQLASVQPGSVLGDICKHDAVYGFSSGMVAQFQKLGDGLPAQATELEGYNQNLGDSIVVLQNNYRFLKSSGIGELGRAVLKGDVKHSLEFLTSAARKDIDWKEIDDEKTCHAELETIAAASFKDLFSAKKPQEAIKLLSRFRILCALNRGPFGVEALNRVVETRLKKEGWAREQDCYYSGQPLLITKNDYRLGLFNGDTGLCFSAGSKPDGDIAVYFAGEENTLRRFGPHRLPFHRTAYAMTVHKSQGSEFDRILLILPPQSAPILSRELIYTAITRARHGVVIWSARDVLEAAIAHSIERTSGLQDELWRAKVSESRRKSNLATTPAPAE